MGPEADAITAALAEEADNATIATTAQHDCEIFIFYPLDLRSDAPAYAAADCLVGEAIPRAHLPRH